MKVDIPAALGAEGAEFVSVPLDDFFADGARYFHTNSNSPQAKL
jgi:hypothetical protein